MASREDLVFQAKVAEQLERYDDLVSEHETFSPR